MHAHQCLEKGLFGICLYDYLVCIHKIQSANPLMIQRQHCIEVISLLELIHCYSKLNRLSVFCSLISDRALEGQLEEKCQKML